MKIALKILLISLGAGAATYAIAYLVRQTKLLANTKFEVVKSSVLFNGITNARVDLDTAITNNSEIDFEIYKQDIDVFVGSKKVSTVTNNNRIALPHGASAKTSYAISFNPIEVLAGIKQSVVENSNNLLQTKITLKGRVSLSAGQLLLNSLPVNYTFQIKDIA